MSKNSPKQPASQFPAELEKLRPGVRAASAALDELAGRLMASGLRMRFLIIIESPDGSEDRWEGHSK